MSSMSSEQKTLTNDLGSQEVVSWGDAGWEVEVPPSSVGDEVVDGPSAGLEVEAIRGDLGPLLGSTVGGGSVVDLCEVGLEWSLVGSSDRVISVVGSVLSWDVLPVGADLVSSVDSDDGVAVLDVGAAAGKVSRVNVHDWVVGVLGANAGVGWLDLSVDGDLVENGVRRGSGAQRENRCECELHGC